MAADEIGPSPGLPSKLANKSCERCRALKVRCIQNPANPAQCDRCSSTNTQCVFVAPAKRRPRMRTASRMSRLERELEQMRSSLATIGAKQSTTNEQSSGHEVQQKDVQSRPRMGSHNGTNILTNSNFIPGSMLVGMDVIDRGIVSLPTAQDLTAFFAQELTKFFPIVLSYSDMNASFLRRKKPILFLSILAASALTLGMDIAKALQEELLARHAHAFFVSGEKSVELIQAIIIAAVYEYPASSRKHLKLCQFTHVACTMALELGLHVRFSEVEKEGLLFDDKASQARAILICYHLASSNATKSGGLNMVPRVDFLKECVQILESSDNICDRQLACWFRLQQILDDTLMSFSLDTTRYQKTEERPQLRPILQYFNTCMQSWKDSLVDETRTCWLMLEYYNTHIVVYEAAHGEAVRDPGVLNRQYFTLPQPETDRRNILSGPPLNATWVDISAKWIDAAQGVLNIFLGSDVVQMRNFPEICFSRVFGALTSLLRIYDAACSTALGTVITIDSIGVEGYIDSLIHKLFLASDNGHYKVPDRWYGISLKKREWYQGQLAKDLRPDAHTSLSLQNDCIPGLVQMPAISGTIDTPSAVGYLHSNFINHATTPGYDVMNGAMTNNLEAQFPWAAPFQ